VGVAAGEELGVELAAALQGAARGGASPRPRASRRRQARRSVTRRGLRRSGGSTCGTQRPSASRPSLAVRRGPHGEDRWGETRTVGLEKRQVARRLGARR
jgi:hypothetical protein